MSEVKYNHHLTGDEIAVIGMDGRFPGASSIHEFWENLKNGQESIRFFSREELAETGAAPEILENPNYVKAVGMLEEVGYFDAAFFNYTLREAEVMDPQFRVLHQCCWKALEDSGYNPEDDIIGFYCGAGLHVYWMARMLAQPRSTSDLFGLMAVTDNGLVITQVAYRLNLRGPAFCLQTACSSSLTAIHEACQALISGECDMALAGGVSVRLPLRTGYIYQEGMVHSPDGHCRAFDARAAGTVAGNGVGIVVLKPLENARQDHDHIYGLVKGTAVNNDGNRRIGYTAPSVKGQSDVIRIAQQAAGVEPESITYIETHGTGTLLGDPIEIRALVKAFHTTKQQFCRLGSVKSNIGHLDAAAGVAGFIKTLLALYHHMIPPTLHFEQSNPEVNFENSPFIVNTRLYEWKTNGYPRRAGVNSFGIGGTNAHVILEEAPQGTRGLAPLPIGQPSREYQLLILSARTREALERNTHSLKDFLEKNSYINFANAAYTLQLGRKAFEYRRTLVCKDSKEAVEILLNPQSKKCHTLKVPQEKPRVVFMFSGLGSQYPGMGYHLYNDEPVFRQEMDQCFEILKPLMDYDIKEIISPGRGEVSSPAGEPPAACNLHLSPDINQMEIAQPVIFAFEYALARLLMKWGITPHALIGYSFGEYTAAAIAGVFTLENALKVIVQRGKLLSQTPQGAMLSVPLTREQLQGMLPQNSQLSIAIDNGPSCIVAGSKKMVDEFAVQLKQNKVLSMCLNAAYAVHSTLMNSILPGFQDMMRKIPLKEPQIPYISNLTGQWLKPEEAVDPGYWARHLVNTVRFAEGIKELAKEPRVIFLELGPGRDLNALVQRYLGENHRALNLVRPQYQEISDTAYLLDRIGRLWLYGKKIDWKKFYYNKAQKRYRVPLPTYCFERQQFELEEKAFPYTVSDADMQTPATAHTYPRTQLPDHYEIPRDELEEKIARTFQSIFGLDRISIHDDFFELGGDSLKVITLVTELHQRMNVDVSMESVFRHPTVKDLANFIGEKGEKSIFSAIPAAEEREYYPLPPPQLRVFVMEQIEARGMAYNQPTVMWMQGPLDTSRFEQVYQQLLQRHESLRTGFFLQDGEPVQRVYRMDEIEPQLVYVDLSADELDQEAREKHTRKIIENFMKPFVLSRPPLWKVGFVKTAENKYLFMEMIHHIVSDDISIGVLMRELSRLYGGEPLKPAVIQYKDYVVWHAQVAPAHSDLLKKQKAFWLDRFSDASTLPVLQMPFDFPRPQLQSFQGAHLGTQVHQDFHHKLVNLARKNKTTLFVVLFTLFNTVLHKYTGQEDIILGIPITGRFHRDIQDTVGMFVNTLALRNHPKGYMTFETFLHQVKEEVLQSFANQLYQFEELVEQLDIPRDVSRNPLFDAMFVLHTVNLMEDIKLPGVKSQFYEFEHPACRFDLILNAAETAQGLNVGLEYTTALFKRETIARFLEDLLQVAETVIENPRLALDEIKISAPPKTMDTPVKTTPVLTPEEMKKILYEFNNTEVNYPKHKTLHRLFAEQANNIPDHIALVGQTGGLAPLFNLISITYNQLNQKSNQLAHILKEKGVQTEDITAIMGDGSIGMIIGILGILKAGGAYLPIDPGYPRERLDFMLKDSNVGVLLTTPKLQAKVKAEVEENFGQLRQLPLQLINIESELAPAFDPSLSNSTLTSTCQVSATNLAYIMYTSGSTGRPKGVMVQHRSVVRLVKGANYVELSPDTRILRTCAPVFDVFTFEVWGALLNGGQLYLEAHHVILEANQLGKAIKKHQVNLLWLTSPLFNQLEQQDCRIFSPLEWLLVGGDVLSPPHINRVRKQNPGVKLVNGYGPTENTTFSSCYLIDKDFEKNIPIGKPISNSTAFILDKYDQWLPIGIAGELCVGGDGVSRGYLNKPQLTAERFCLRKNFLLVQNERIDSHMSYMSYMSHIYRTGDRARWLADGNIEFLGRMDLQVKIRGFRVELEEIKNQMLTINGIKESVVMARQDSTGTKYLCAYLVSDTTLDIASLRHKLSKRLPDYMIPSYLMQVPEIPLSPNGKVDTRALPGPNPKRTAPYAAPGNEKQKILANIWARILELEKVGIDDNFFEIGGDSIKAIQVASRLQKNKLKMEVSQLFLHKTIRKLEKHLNPINTSKDRGADQGIVLGTVQLTPIQHWFFNHHLDYGRHFNQSVLLYRKDGFNEEIVKRVFTKIVSHHDALRMVYRVQKGQVLQTNRGITGPLFDLEVIRLSQQGKDQRAEEIRQAANPIQRGIDWSNGPLVKLGLFKGTNGDNLLIVIHHLVVDTVSWRILLEDFEIGYQQVENGFPITFQEKTTSFQYWAQKVTEYAESKSLLHQLPLWKTIEDTQLKPLPVDHEISNDQRTYKHHDMVCLTMTKKRTQQLLTRVNWAYHTEINDILLTALGLAVHQWAGIDKVLVNLEGHGRENIVRDVDITRTIGWFTTQYPVIMDMQKSHHTGFAIKQVKETLRQIPHKGIGYGILKYLAPPEKKASIRFKHTPEILFNYLGQFRGEESGDIMDQHSSGISGPITGDNISPHCQDHHKINIEGATSNGKLTLSIFYNQHEYEKETIEQLARCFLAKLDLIIDHCTAKEENELTPSDLGCNQLSIRGLQTINHWVKKTLGKDTQIQSIYPLSPMQEEMFLATLANRQSYFVQNVFSMSASIDTGLLEKALNRLIERYDIFRTIFMNPAPGPMQIVLNRRKLEINVENIHNINRSDKVRWAKEFKETDRRRGFELAKDLAFRVTRVKTGEDFDLFIWSMHHIVVDGWCLGTITANLIHIYDSLAENKEISLEPVYPYKNYIQWLAQQDNEEGLQYWQEYLHGYRQQPMLAAIGNPEAREGKYQLDQYFFTLDENVNQGLNRLVLQNSVTLNTLFLTVWGLLLQGNTGTKDVLFGSIVSGRSCKLEGIETMIGLFMNILPVRIRTRADTHFSQFLQEVQHQCILSRDYEHLPLREILSRSSLNMDTVDSLVFFENYPTTKGTDIFTAQKESNERLRLELIENHEQIDYSLNLYVVPGKVIQLRFCYNSLIYARNFIECTAANLKKILRQVIENPGVLLSTVLTGLIKPTLLHGTPSKCESSINK